MLANKHHLLAGDQALRVAAGFGLARICPTVRLAALTEHEERYTVANEFLPADLRKTVPAHDMRLCILNRETKRTMLEAQWGTTRDCSHLGNGSIGWGEKHVAYWDNGCRGWCCLWRTAPFSNACGARRPLAQCRRLLARRVFLRRITHACVARALRLPCTSVVMSVSAWPSQQGASHRCEGFHTLQRSSWLNFQSTFPRLPPDPLVANHTDGHQIGVNSWVHVCWYMEMTCNVG